MSLYRALASRRFVQRASRKLVWWVVAVALLALPTLAPSPGSAQPPPPSQAQRGSGRPETGKLSSRLYPVAHPDQASTASVQRPGTEIPPNQPGGLERPTPTSVIVDVVVDDNGPETQARLRQ